jgi:AcrR family transcriptional regulator
MPVKAGSTLDPEATRARVLTVAERLFYERGVHAVGINEIAARAEASKLTIYRYFQSKEGLVEAILRERSDRIYRWLVASSESAPRGRGQVLALFDALTRWYAERGFRGCAVVNAATDSRGDDTGVGDLARGHLARYRSLLESYLRDAGLDRPERLARQLLLLIEGATVVTAIDGEVTAGHDAHAAAETLLDAALPDRGAS